MIARRPTKTSRRILRAASTGTRIATRKTNPTDVDTDEDEDYPLEYYLKQQDDFDESEFTSED
jgi:hypothetical protein